MATPGKALRKWIHDRAFYARARRNAGASRVSPALDLNGKTAAVFGVATDQSIAWSIAKTLNDHGCRIALGYQERAAEYVQVLARELHDPLLQTCELTDDAQISAFFGSVAERFAKIDFLIHSVAFAKREFLEGPYLSVDRKGFLTAQDVSAYSLTALVKAAETSMNTGGRVITLSFLGSQRAFPGYNVMGVAKAALESSVRYLARDLGPRGITVNAISPGPIKTLAASAISGFDAALAHAAAHAPLKRNVSAQDAANTALFLCSSLAENITGQVIYVDAGFSAV